MRVARRLTLPVLLMALLAIAAGNVRSQEVNGIDPEALIERILTVEAEQRSRIDDVIFETEFVEGENKDDGFEEKVRLVKRTYLKFLPDTVLFHEDYLEFYKKGELQSDEDCRKEARDREEKKRKRKARDISYRVLNPFLPEHRPSYHIEYRGVAAEPIAGHTCQHFAVKATAEADSLINGDFFFDAESFNLIQVRFSPSKLTKNLAFRMKNLNMTLTFGETAENFWLPRRFDIDGKGKLGFLFGVSFSGTEYYLNPVVNSGLGDELFEGEEYD